MTSEIDTESLLDQGIGHAKFDPRNHEALNRLNITTLRQLTQLTAAALVALSQEEVQWFQQDSSHCMVSATAISITQDGRRLEDYRRKLGFLGLGFAGEDPWLLAPGVRPLVHTDLTKLIVTRLGWIGVHTAADIPSHMLAIFDRLNSNYFADLLRWCKGNDVPLQPPSSDEPLSLNSLRPFRDRGFETTDELLQLTEEQFDRFLEGPARKAELLDAGWKFRYLMKSSGLHFAPTPVPIIERFINASLPVHPEFVQALRRGGVVRVSGLLRLSPDEAYEVVCHHFDGLSVPPKGLLEESMLKLRQQEAAERGTGLGDRSGFRSSLARAGVALEDTCSAVEGELRAALDVLAKAPSQAALDSVSQNAANVLGAVAALRFQEQRRVDLADGLVPEFVVFT